jgi:hypothetical protein
MVWKANRNVWTAHHTDGKIVVSGRPYQNLRNFQNYFSDTETVACPDSQGYLSGCTCQRL